LAQIFLNALTLSNIIDLRNYFSVRIRRKFGTIPSLKIPPHLKCVVTLPCEMSSVLKAYWQQDDFCINTF